MSRRLTAACPYQHGLHRNVSQSASSDLNRRSRAPEARAVFTTNRARLSHTLKYVRGLPRTILHPVGVEPTHPPWRDGTLPLRHRCS